MRAARKRFTLRFAEPTIILASNGSEKRLLHGEENRLRIHGLSPRNTDRGEGYRGEEGERA